MPHSSGGGSHSGGSSGSSSGGSWSSSSGGSSGGPSIRTSKSYFPGAHAFVYYRHHSPVYVYSDTDLTRQKGPGKIRYLLLLFYIPFIFAICSMLAEAIHVPTKLKNTQEYQVYVEDNANVIDNESVLINSLSAFKEKTGITPVIVTVNNENWQQYRDLSSYAYDLYVNRFDDETHWLIVYSEPTEVDASFIDWYWEGMQGNDTDPILVWKYVSSFNENVQKRLTARTKYSIEQAFAKSFDDLTPIVMSKSFDTPVLLTAIGMLAFIAVHAYFMVFFGNNQKYKNEELTEIKTGNKQSPATAVCEYCGGTYVVGAHVYCPHCGAAISSYQQFERP